MHTAQQHERRSVHAQLQSQICARCASGRAARRQSSTRSKMLAARASGAPHAPEEHDEGDGALTLLQVSTQQVQHTRRQDTHAIRLWRVLA